MTPPLKPKLLWISRGAHHYGPGLWLWIVYIGWVVVGRHDGSTTSGSVCEIYREASLRWISGENLYDGTGDGFIYFPSAALLLAPLTILSSAWGATLWRIINLWAFASGCWRTSTVCGGSDPRRTFLYCTLSAIPIAWSAARHGQMTLFSGGAFMYGLVYLWERRSLRSALALVLCVGMKPIFLPAVLALWLVFQELRKPLAIVFPLSLLATFAFQSPEYVGSQWLSAFQMLTDVGARAGEPGRSFVNLRGLLATSGLQQIDLLHLVVAASLMACLIARLIDHRVRGLAVEMLPVVYILVAGATLLCSPATESNTYALMGPAIGFLAATWGMFGASALRYVGFLVLPMVGSRSCAQAMPGTALAYLKVLVTVLLVLGAWWVSPAGTATDRSSQA